MYGCYAYGGTTGFQQNNGSDEAIAFCVADGCSSYGFNWATNSGMVLNCTAYNCSKGFYAGGGNFILVNLVATSCTYGFYSNGGPYPQQSLVNCAGYNNTTDYSGFNASGLNQNIAGFISLTAQPFTSTSTPNFTLNTTTGGGAALTDVGCPAAIPGLAGNTNINIGAYQNALSAGGGVATPIMRYMGS